MDKKTYQSVLKLICLAAFLALVVVYFSTVGSMIKKIWGLLSPLALGIVFAYLIDIPTKWLETHLFRRLKRPSVGRVLSILVSLFLFLLVIACILVLLLPQLGVALKQFGTNLPVLYQESVQSLDEFVQSHPELAQGYTVVQNYINTFMETIKAITPKIPDYAISIFGGVVNSVLDTAIALIFSLYLLFGKKRLLEQLAYLLKRFVPEKHSKRVFQIRRVANSTFGKFFTGQFLEALILGTLCTLGMLLFRFPYALTVGSVVGVSAIIPLVGAYIGGVIGFVLIFGQGLKLAILFLVFLVILQQIEGNLIYPRVVGTSVGLPGVWVFAAVILGAGLFGIAGVLFGVPLAATLYQLIKEDRKQFECKSVQNSN